ncbi:hypothetical protein SLS58_001881 [Diplodia intermedia]|uniref:Ankyrin repeat protein n=1 Tax=Diplodia intermedia TaxID=856260 RepID=A0ABR3U0X1_9PEZI
MRAYPEADKVTPRFRWVACQIDYLCDLPNDDSRRDALTKLPPDLFSTYDRILERTNMRPPPVRQLFHNTLRWLSFHGQLMSTAALCEALSIHIGDKKSHHNSRPDEEDVLLYCSSLVRKTEDGESLEISHFTVTEYLKALSTRENPELARYCIDSSVDLPYLLEVVVDYLNFEDFGCDLPANAEQWSRRAAEFPFRKPATSILQSDAHLEKTRILFDPRKTLNFLNFLMDLSIYTSHSLLDDWSLEECFDRLNPCVTAGSLSPLHISASLQLRRVTAWLVQKTSDPDQMSPFGTPLHCALLGWPGVLTMFLGCRFEAPENWTPVARCALVNILLEAGADPKRRLSPKGKLPIGSMYMALISLVPGQGGEDPVLVAVGGAGGLFDEFCLEVFAYEIGQYAQDNKRSKDKALAIARTVKREWVEPAIHDRFLELASRVDTSVASRWINANGANKIQEALGQDANALEGKLWTAARMDLSAELEGLLKRPGIEVNSVRDEWGRTVLHGAVSHGSWNVTKSLLSSGANVNQEDAHSRISLHYCGNVHSAQMVFLLLDNGADRDHEDDEGCLLWHLAARNNNVEALNALISRTEDPTHYASKQALNGQLPLHYAAGAGAEEALFILLPYARDLNAEDKNGFVIAHMAVHLSLTTFHRLLDAGMALTVKSKEGLTPLHTLVSRSVVEGQSILKENPIPEASQTKLNILLQRGLDPFATTTSGETPLHILLDQSGLNFDTLLCSIIRSLSGIDSINLLDESGNTPLHYLCRNASSATRPSEGLQILLANGADVAKLDDSGKNCFAILAYSVSADEPKPKMSQVAALFETLFDHWPDPDILPAEFIGVKIMFNAIRISEKYLVEKVLEAGVQPYRRFPKWKSPLEYACTVGCENDILDLLIQNTSKDFLLEMSPSLKLGLLHLACLVDSRASPANLELLLHAGIPVDLLTGDEPSMTAVMIAAAGGKQAHMEVLLKHGADVHKTDAQGRTPAVYAAKNEQCEVLQALEDFGGTNLIRDVLCTENFTNTDGYSLTCPGCSLLHVASNSPETLEYLTSKSHFSNVDCRATGGETPLHLAAFQGNLKCIQILVVKGADTNALTQAKLTPLHYAARNKDPAITKLLVSHGADVNAADSTGSLAVHQAAVLGHGAVVSTLLDLGSALPKDKDGLTPELCAQLYCHTETADLITARARPNYGR